MDYKSKYKDLMEKVEAVKKDPRIGLKKGTYYNGYVQTGIRDALEYITTEESEDERMMNWLINQLDKNYKGNYWASKAIAYLEKQKEQQTLILDGEIEDRKRDIVAAIRKYYPADYAEYLTSFLKGLSLEDNSEE